MSINEEHEKAVRETRVKVATAVQKGATEQARKSTGWKRVVWYIVAGAAALAGWWYGSATSQVQPPVDACPPAPAETAILPE